MLEFAECHTISRQLEETVKNKKIVKTVANHSPHKFAFFKEEPEEYPQLLNQKTFGSIRHMGGFIEAELEDMRLLMGDGVNIRYFPAAAKLPDKHQLLLKLDDGSHLICSVQMYGGMWAYPAGTNDDFYYQTAVQKPSPLSAEFDIDYFEKLYTIAKKTLSAKAFLATEQRIPGLGNGTLQDILFYSNIHPKTKIKDINGENYYTLFKKLKETIKEMCEKGGRNTEKDLFGQAGGYQTALSSKTWKNPCPICRDTLIRQNYLGGNIYYCPSCQPLPEM